MKKNSLLVLLLLTLPLMVIGQSTSEKKMGRDGLLFLPYLSYGGDVPLNDLKNRFGTNLGIHGGIDMVWPNNYSVGLTANYKFGDKVTEDVLSSLRQSNDKILGTNGVFAEVLLKERGLYLGARIGKLIPLHWYNDFIDLKFDVGVGYFSHYVLIRNDGEDVPQLKGDLVKGYDRLSNGIGLNQSLALHYNAKNSWRVYIAVESIQGFTSNVRSLQYDKVRVVDESRVDVMLGVHVGFVMPFSVGAKGEEVYY